MQTYPVIIARVVVVGVVGTVAWAARHHIVAMWVSIVVPSLVHHATLGLVSWGIVGTVPLSRGSICRGLWSGGLVSWRPGSSGFFRVNVIL